MTIIDRLRSYKVGAHDGPALHPAVCDEAAAALEQIKKLVAGDRVPNWEDDWQTTHTRGLILDIIDGAISVSSQQGNAP